LARDEGGDLMRVASDIEHKQVKRLGPYLDIDLTALELVALINIRRQE